MRISLFILLLTSHIVFSQCGEIGFYPLNGNNVAVQMEKTNDGNLLLVMQMNGSVVIRKVDQSGNYLLSKTIYGTGLVRVRDLAVDKEDNVYITGDFGSAINLGSGFNFSATSVANQLYVAKLDTSLNTIWAQRSFGNTNSSAQGSETTWSVDVDTLGYCYFSGNFEATFEFDGQDFSLPTSSKGKFLARLDPDTGSLVWMKTEAIAPSNIYPKIQASENGNVFSITNFLGSVYDADSNIYYSTPSGNSNTLVQYIDSSGNLLWARHLKGDLNFGASQLDDSGNLHIIGQMGDTLDYTSGMVDNLYSKGIFHLSIDQSNNVIEAARIATSQFTNYFEFSNTAFHYLSPEEYYISGITNYEVNFNGLVSPDINPGEFHFFAARYSLYNTPVWSKSFMLTDSQVTAGIRKMDSCSVYFFGKGYASLYYDSLNQVSAPSTSISFLLEFEPGTGELTDPANYQGGGFGGPNGVGIEENKWISSIGPNPTNGKVHIVLGNKEDEVLIRQLSLDGRIVKEGQSFNSDQFDFEMTGVSGYYFIEIQNKEKKRSRYRILKM